MKSPFPGMDPYLEQHWGDVHTRLIMYAADRLQEGLPRDLRARVEERVFVESQNGSGRSIYPDIRVIEVPVPGRTAAGGAEATAVAEPIIVHLPDERATQRYIEIVDVGSGNRVVTVIEVLSPSNKLAGEGQNLYLQKQQELKLGRVSLVEIDLLRGGKRVQVVSPGQIPPSHRTTYQICVRLGWQPHTPRVYAAPLRERLPVIAIPLREADEPVPLDIQALVDQAYHNGRYDDIDYRTEPDPPLNAADAQWADELLRARSLRD